MKSVSQIILTICLMQLVHSQTQAEMTENSKAVFFKSEYALSAVFDQILDSYKTDLKFITNIKKSQKLWLQWREAEVLAKYPEEDGSITPMCKYDFKKQLNNNRISQLKVWLTGVDDNEACGGSVKIIERK